MGEGVSIQTRNIPPLPELTFPPLQALLLLASPFSCFKSYPICPACLRNSVMRGWATSAPPLLAPPAPATDRSFGI